MRKVSMRNKFFWIGFIMFILFFLSRHIEVSILFIEPTFTYTTIFYIIPVTFMIYGIIKWKVNKYEK